MTMLKMMMSLYYVKVSDRAMADSSVTILVCVSTAQSSFELGPRPQQPLLHSNKIDESDNIMTKKERMADTEPLEQQEDTAKQHDIEVDSTVQSNGVIQRTEEENSWTGGAERHSPEGEVSVKKKKTKKHKKDKAKKKEKNKLEQPQQDEAKVEKDDDKKAEVSDPESTATEIEVMVETNTPIADKTATQEETPEAAKLPAIDVHTAAAATSRGETNTPIADKTATQEETPEAAKLTATKEELFKNVAAYDPTATTQTKKEEPAAVTKEQEEPTATKAKPMTKEAAICRNTLDSLEYSFKSILFLHKKLLNCSPSCSSGQARLASKLAS